MKQRMKQIDESIAHYLSELDTADRQQAVTGMPVPEAKVERLTAKIDALKKEVKRLKALETELLKTEDKQISLTDPDARSMATTSRHPRVVGYNVQSVVDTEHHLIIAHEVTNIGPDRGQLSNMASQACDALDTDKIDVVADRGYYKGEEIVTCENADITVCVPKPLTSNARAAGRFDKRDFVYRADEDVYICPAGERLTYRFTNEERGKILHSTGPPPVRHARSRINAPPVLSVGSSDGNMKPYLSACRPGSIATRTRCGYAAKPLNTLSGRLRRGWAPRTSR